MNDRNSTSSPTLWMSVQTAASELEVTTRTIYRFINDGKLAAYRIGRVYRIRRADFQDFLNRSALRPGDLDHLVEDHRDDTTNGGAGPPAGHNGDRPGESGPDR